MTDKDTEKTTDDNAKNTTDTNAEPKHESPKKKAPAKADHRSNDQKAVDAGRGPMGHAQDESDGWGDLPVQMRGE